MYLQVLRSTITDQHLFIYWTAEQTRVCSSEGHSTVTLLRTIHRDQTVNPHGDLFH